MDLNDWTEQARRAQGVKSTINSHESKVKHVKFILYKGGEACKCSYAYVEIFFASSKLP